MESVREKWTDERLDDLNGKVGELARRTDAGFRELRREMSARFERVDARLDALHRTLVQLGAAMIAALIGLFAAQIGLIVTQL